MNVDVGLGWDVGSDIFEDDIDIDLAAFQLSNNGKIQSEDDFIFYNNPTSSSGAIQFLGDNKIGSIEDNLENEVIHIDSNKISNDVDRVIISATIFEARQRKQNFAMVLNAFVRVYDQNNETEIMRYDLSEDFSYSHSIIIGEFIRNNDSQFIFHPLGTSFDGELGDLCEKYGLYVEG